MPHPARQAHRSIVGYCRVSTEEQAREGVSLDAQEARIRAYVDSRGFKLARVAIDGGASGKSLERPQLQALLAEVRAGTVGMVIVARLDRLTRKTRDLLELVEDVFRRHAVELVSLAEQIDTSSAGGRMLLTMLGALAQMEREQIAERTTAALAFKKSRGERLGGIPLGFIAQAPGGPLEGRSSELVTVRLILNMRAAGATYQAIANELRDSGTPTKKGGAWRVETVRKVWMARERYASVLHSA